uniref:GMP phosphodiesterase delta subunit domain-containing protein n=1 Tax=Fibrocapsa japonica TaxID=94617 RepID=A0A7S2V4X0_9STRA|mmetsp:Transcript_3115/g.4599  ORF Transcript_3115/g.4599 Transcript_3115/m.4599 type:complete len:216 (+) Transcript_3115:69-716(+)|eukprot:CAMPEP_0113943900 /NCGR_PEP_ID=MMETSP1339-20121228/29361_1 /TAXON_ID=94617 /ORGANISM="Fibrocapsa japonica" /LENGTH=215 /DNA_ID=CAMNT_0000948895 /DNA_START=23 /DNA_END=670 /DNA_ORIENTATION=+ /assembly_acc=CAM_ASM_000762
MAECKPRGYSGAKVDDDDDGDYFEEKHGRSQLDVSDTDKSYVDEDEEAEREWNLKLNAPQKGSIAVSQNPQASRIMKGFTINWMNMKDAYSGQIVWESDSWGSEMFETEMSAYVPSSILNCRAVAREINFSSVDQIKDFNLEQRVYFNGTCIEEWFFRFGFVIPNSTNTWEQIIEAADPENMMDPTILSGNVTIETTFLDGSIFLCKTLVRIFYE